MKFRLPKGDIDKIPDRVVCVDIETTGLEWASRVLVIAITVQQRVADTHRYSEHDGILDKQLASTYPIGESVRLGNFEVSSVAINVGYRDLWTEPMSMIEARRIVESAIDGADMVTGHNLTFDYPYLMRSQVLTYDEVKHRTFDTMVMSRATGGYLSVSLLNMLHEKGIFAPKELTENKKLRKNMEKMSPDKALDYALVDARKGMELFNHIWLDAVQQYDQAWLEKEGRYTALVSKMRLMGIQLSREKITKHLSAIVPEMKRINIMLYQNHIWGPNSSATLSKYLLLKGIRLPKTEKGTPKTDLETLMDVVPAVRNMVAIDELNDAGAPIPDELLLSVVDAPEASRVVYELLLARKYDKMKSTWLDGYLDRADSLDRVHPLWKTGGTISFRLSCSKPNAQSTALDVWGNPPDKQVYEMDYSQAEVRLGAAYANETRLAEVFFNNGDVHYNNSLSMYGESMADAKRFLAKRATFTIQYGGGKDALAKATGISLAEASDTIQRWKKAHPNMVAIAKFAEAKWAQQGYLTLLGGKRLYFIEGRSKTYAAWNQLVQGSVSEVIKYAMLQIDKELPNLPMVAQVHDSIRVEDEPDGKQAARAAEIMADAPEPFGILSRTDPPIRMKVDIKKAK